jgi:hypothetical protein
MYAISLDRVHHTIVLYYICHINFANYHANLAQGELKRKFQRKNVVKHPTFHYPTGEMSVNAPRFDAFGSLP